MFLRFTHLGTDMFFYSKLNDLNLPALIREKLDSPCSGEGARISY